MKLTWTYFSECPICGEARFNLLTGFLHDVKCWNFLTALYNLSMIVRRDLGLIELAVERIPYVDS